MKLFSHCILFILAGSACSSQNKSQSTQAVISFKELAESKYQGKNIEYTASADSLFILCLTQEKGNAQMPQNRIKYMVVELASGIVLVEGNVMGGTVKWYNAESLEIFRIPGIMAQGQTADNYTEILNVKTKESMQKSNLKN